MQHISRVLVALTILLSGAALIPFVDVPAETFEWQRYAGVYEEPDVVVNYTYGQPGSFFRFTGSGFSANSPVAISANGNLLGTATTDGAGNLEFNVNSSSASLGSYYITVSEGNVSNTVRITLLSNTPLRPQEGTANLFLLPAGTGITEMYLPLITR